MNKYYIDLHVHIGRSSEGHIVKMATSNNLTFENIAYDSLYRKGIDIIGVVDCISPYVLHDIDALMDRGEMVELKNGGMRYKDGLTVLLGSEMETKEENGSHPHSVVFFPYLNQMKEFSNVMKKYITNIYSFSTMAHIKGQDLVDIVDNIGGIMIPAHVFTPFKSYYGNCTDRLSKVFSIEAFNKIPSIELGLSADADMASQLSELDNKTFISDSDAHSLAKIGREYNTMLLEAPNYDEVYMALRNIENRKILANYGLNPKLGKYHRTYCIDCDRVVVGPPHITKCSANVKHHIVMGVLDRLELIKDREADKGPERAPYYYQIPLEFLPSIGPKTIDRLISSFGNEMAVLHDVPFEELKRVVKLEIAEKIIFARMGMLDISVGGGGTYGKIIK